MYNKVILIGNLTRDPEIRYTPTGTPVTSFGLACNRKYKDANGYTKEDVYFGEVSVWGKQGEHCNTYLRKGSKALVEGRLSSEKWTANNGEQKSRTRIVAESVKFLDSKDRGNQRSDADDSDIPPEAFTDTEVF